MLVRMIHEHQSHKHPASLSSHLLYKTEIQGIGLPVNEPDAELSTGARPGFFRFPEIGIRSRGWIIAQRARPACHCTFHRVNRIESITLDATRLRKASCQDRESLVSTQAEFDRNPPAGIHLIDYRRVLDRIEEALEVENDLVRNAGCCCIPGDIGRGAGHTLSPRSAGVELATTLRSQSRKRVSCA
jgi:hypothetical protein